MLCSRIAELRAENSLDIHSMASQSNLAYVAILVARGGLYLLQHSTQSPIDYTGTQRCQMRVFTDLFTKEKMKQRSASYLLSQDEAKWQMEKK